jgi:hypothetical protein
MNEIEELISGYYPLSKEALMVVEQSLKSIGSNTFIDYNSVEIEIVPVFIAKLLNRLEAGGSVINFVEMPQKTSVYKYSYLPKCVSDSIPIKHTEEEIMSIAINDIVNVNKGKTMDLFSISIAVDKKSYNFLTYLTGNINE